MSKVPAVFKERSLPATVQTAIMESDPEFAKRPEKEQREVVEMYLDEAERTLENVRSQFPLIKLLHAGATLIQLPATGGEEEGRAIKEFEGVILDQYLTKAYWEKRMGKGETSAPDCASVDGINPYVKDPVTSIADGGCVRCPFNRFGSGVDQDGNQTRGKRCRDQKRVIMHLEGHRLPSRLILSAMNLRPMDEYLSSLSDRGLTMGSVITKFKAVEAKNRTGTTYTGLEFSVSRKLNVDEKLELKRAVVDPYRDQFRVGAIEVDEGDDGDSRPSKDEMERESARAKAADVM